MAPSSRSSRAANIRQPADVRDARATVLGVSSLRKRYDQLEAVRGIDLQVRRGRIIAFLGPNSAGKTTTVEILEGFRGRSAGQISVLGIDPAHAERHWRDRVGVVLHESQAEPGLRVRECLQLYAGYIHPRRFQETIALVGLQQQAEVPTERLSCGQRRRLDVAAPGPRSGDAWAAGCRRHYEIVDGPSRHGRFPHLVIRADQRSHSDGHTTGTAKEGGLSGV